MSNDRSSFVYVTYVGTTPDELWKALTTPELMRRYWFGHHIEADWKVRSPWRLVKPDGTVAVSGQIRELDAPRRIALTWRDQLRPEIAAEGEAGCLIDLEPEDGATKLTLTHSSGVDDSKLVPLVSRSWPRILSNLKSLVETGETVLGRASSVGGVAR